MAQFTISKKITIEKYNELKPYSDIISYSSKTNQTVTTILEENTDSLFSIHFINELKHVKDKSRVLYLAQGWNTDLIQTLIQQNINFFAIDNEIDLKILENYLNENKDKKINGKKLKIKLLLRLKLKENTIKTERYFVFGMSSVSISKNIPILKKKYGETIEEIGIHFHRKTQNMSEWNLKYELSNIFTKETLSQVDIINIGGGLPSKYANTNMNVINGIFARLLDLKKWLNEQKIKLVIEPGRYIAAPAGRLETNIMRIYENNIIVDASVYNSDMDAILVPVKLLIENELTKDKGEPYVIKGMTPCSMDLFRYRIYLKDPKEGDNIIFLNAGAYNFWSNFCDLEEIKTIIVD